MNGRPATDLVDTMIFSRMFLPKRSDQRLAPDIQPWRSRLLGFRVLIAFQTHAEVLSGALLANWGESRLTATRAVLARTPTLGVSEDVIEAYAQLTSSCRAIGHALQDKPHTSDRWIAACAIAHEVPLATTDRIFRDAPGLRLIA